MNKINSYIGKIFFGLTVVAVLFKEEILPGQLDVGVSISLLAFGFFIMIVGLVLDDRQRLSEIKAEKERKEKWIRSLYGKE